MKSKKVYFLNNYNQITETLKNEPFCIFGNTRFAHTFYLYCKEKNISQNIKAFILSDLSKAKGKMHILHDIPIKDVEWLKQQTKCSIFLGAREKTIQQQLLPMLQDQIDGDIYYVSDFANDNMYHKFMSTYYEPIIEKYKISASLYQIGGLNISDAESIQYYKYMSRIAQGEVPDTNIFYGIDNLDSLYNRQLGSYKYIDTVTESYVSKKKCSIYMVKSHFDKELKEEFNTPYTKVIQVGADLTDIDIAKLKDNTGDNISSRNRDYCEVSAIYWVWKNDNTNDYVGFCHYRRRFAIDEAMLHYIMENAYDAVYTIPVLTDGGMYHEFIGRNYFLTPKMWELTTNAITKLCPEYLEFWREYANSYFILPCNMFIMKKNVFDKFCEWLFSILKEVDTYYLGQGIQCDNRYLGYIAECLTTVYVMKHKSWMKKCYVEMKILESK